MAILDDFDGQLPLLNALSPKLHTLITELLATKSLRVHSVSTRIKSRESLEGKLSRFSGKYEQLNQITDLCGVRIVTYLEDEVDAVAALVEVEFDRDSANSIDKRQTAEFDRFGYSSVHYVVSLKATRAQLPEYARFANLKFEIQIRSILQHAWAEIEHDLQYKGQDAVPRELRRSFARLAGLLELADAEFMRIRDQIASYRAHVAETIKTAPEEVFVDSDSLRTLIIQSKLIGELDKEIAAALNAGIDKDIANYSYLIAWFNRLGLTTIKAMDVSLGPQNAGRLVRFAQNLIHSWEPDAEPRTASRGISLWYFGYFLLAQLGSASRIEEIFREIDFRPSGGGEKLANELIAAARSL